MRHRRLLAGGAVVAALVGHATGCATFGGGAPDTSEGEAVLAALEHMAARKWEGNSTLVEGRLAVAYDGENPLSESTRYKVHVEWLGSLYSERLGRDWAELGGEGLLLTRGADGWEVEVHMMWIT